MDEVDKKQLHNRRVHLIILSLIISLAFFLRIFIVTEAPAGFFADEAAIGYNAYKLLLTGRDEHNVPWPVFFQSLGDYRPPVLVYSNIPAIILFGLSEFSVRFTAAAYGAGTVFLIYFIGKKLMSIRLGLLSSFLLAVSPWHIHMSRWGAETITFPFFFCLGLYLYLASLEKPVKLPFSFLAFAVSLYTYYPAWVVIPLFLAGIIAHWFWKNKFRSFKYLILGIFVLAITSVPLIVGIKGGYALSRWNSINRQSITFRERFENFRKFYIEHFGVEFLFTKGDIGYHSHFISRHSIRDMGQLFWFQAPFIIIGIFYLIIRRQKNWILVLYVLLLYPLGSALTIDGPTATRSFIGILPFTLLTSTGIISLFSLIKRLKWYFVVVAVLIAVSSLSLTVYLYRYYKEYPLYSSDYWGWQYGPREIISFFLREYDKYDEFVMTGHFNGAYIFVPFYTLERYPKIMAQWMDKQYDPQKKQLFAVYPEEIKDRGFEGRFKKVKALYYPDGSVAIQIGKVVENN